MFRILPAGWVLRLDFFFLKDSQGEIKPMQSFDQQALMVLPVEIGD
jgi:hypothetical protein